MRKRTFEGRVRRCATQDGLALHACCRLGLIDDPRVTAVAESLAGDAMARRRLELRHPAAGDALLVQRDSGPVLGLAAFGDKRATARGVDFLLRHRVVFSPPPECRRALGVREARYPPYWHYDLLVGLRTLAVGGALADPRTADALDMLESKRQPDGTWRVEGRWWKRPGSNGSNVEVVDWEGIADGLLTQRARDVLSTAGRA